MLPKRRQHRVEHVSGDGKYNDTASYTLKGCTVWESPTYKYHRHILMFTKILIVKLNIFLTSPLRYYHTFLYFSYLLGFFSVVSCASPQVGLHPHDLLLLLPDDGAQAAQQGGLVTPGVGGHAVIQAGQLVQQRLLAPRTRQQTLLWLVVALQLWPGSVGGMNSINKKISYCLLENSITFREWTELGAALEAGPCS